MCKICRFLLTVTGVELVGSVCLRVCALPCPVYNQCKFQGHKNPGAGGGGRLQENGKINSIFALGRSVVSCMGTNPFMQDYRHSWRLVAIATPQGKVGQQVPRCKMRILQSSTKAMLLIRKQAKLYSLCYLKFLFKSSLSKSFPNNVNSQLL